MPSQAAVPRNGAKTINYGNGMKVLAMGRRIISGRSVAFPVFSLTLKGGLQ
jgi:hypothetical protein